MARSTGEIQADIALTRRLIETQLDAFESKVKHRWWMPYALLAGGLAIGFLASRLPILSLISASARTVQTGLTVAGAVAAADRFIAERREPRAA
jgi:hypothetical protein